MKELMHIEWLNQKKQSKVVNKFMRNIRYNCILVHYLSKRIRKFWDESNRAYIKKTVDIPPNIDKKR